MCSIGMMKNFCQKMDTLEVRKSMNYYTAANKKEEGGDLETLMQRKVKRIKGSVNLAEEILYLVFTDL